MYFKWFIRFLMAMLVVAAIVPTASAAPAPGQAKVGTPPTPTTLRAPDESLQQADAIKSAKALHESLSQSQLSALQGIMAKHGAALGHAGSVRAGASASAADVKKAAAEADNALKQISSEASAVLDANQRNLLAKSTSFASTSGAASVSGMPQAQVSGASADAVAAGDATATYNSTYCQLGVYHATLEYYQALYTYLYAYYNYVTYGTTYGYYGYVYAYYAYLNAYYGYYYTSGGYYSTAVAYFKANLTNNYSWYAYYFESVDYSNTGHFYAYWAQYFGLPAYYSDSNAYSYLQSCY